MKSKQSRDYRTDRQQLHGSKFLLLLSHRLRLDFRLLCAVGCRRRRRRRRRLSDATSRLYLGLVDAVGRAVVDLVQQFCDASLDLRVVGVVTFHRHAFLLRLRASHRRRHDRRGLAGRRRRVLGLLGACRRRSRRHAALPRVGLQVVVLVQALFLEVCFFLLFFYQVIIVAADTERRERLFGAAAFPEVRLKRPEVVSRSSGSERRPKSRRG